MEFRIKGNNEKFGVRFRRGFLVAFFALLLAFLIPLPFNKPNNNHWYGFLALLALASIVLIFGIRKVLHRIFLNDASQIVHIEINSFTSVKKYEVNLNDFKVSVRQNFLSRYSPWVLKMYDQNKLIYKQQEVNGWSHKDFMEIEKYFKSLLTP